MQGRTSGGQVKIITAHMGEGLRGQGHTIANSVVIEVNFLKSLNAELLLVEKRVPAVLF